MHPFAQHGGRFQVKGLQAMHCRAGRRRWQHVGRFMKSGKSFPRTRWPPNHFCRREKLNNKLSNEVELESAAIALYFPAHPGSIMAAFSTFIIIAICSNRITIKTMSVTSRYSGVAFTINFHIMIVIDDERVLRVL